MNDEHEQSAIDPALIDAAGLDTAEVDTALTGAAVTDTALTDAAVTDAALTDAAEPRLRPTFAELGVDPRIVTALSDKGINTAFPIQEQTIGMAMGGADLIGQAKTGTGKTLAFGIPVLERVVRVGDTAEGRRPKGLVICPTRELAIQVSADLAAAGRHLDVEVLTVYGGRSYEPQIEALRRGVDVVVGTPGRILDLASQRYLQLGEVGVLVLDEADEMLDMGFLPDVERLVSLIPVRRQTLLFSATMPGQIAALARRYMTTPTHIRASDPHDTGITVQAIEQHVWRAHPLDKVELISRILQAKDRSLVMIFTETKRRAQAVADDLEERGFAAAAVHGDLGQAQRERALRAFRSGKVDVLVATDVAARGLDVDDVSHVINYECPADDKTYVHRIGRTGRAGASGVAVTLVDWADTARWKMINKALGLAFHEPVETYSSSPHVYSELDVPEGAKGRLPRSQRTREGLDAEELEDIGETGGRKSGGRGRHQEHGSRGGGKGGSRGRRTPNPEAGKGPRPASEAGSGTQSDGNTAAGSKPPRRRNRNRSKRQSEPAAPTQSPQAAE
jgi:superfamily II DNA/RNA helicase